MAPYRIGDPHVPNAAKQRPEREEEDLVRLYLGDIGRHQLLTKDDEATLGARIEAGKKARSTPGAERRNSCEARASSLASS